MAARRCPPRNSATPKRRSRPRWSARNPRSSAVEQVLIASEYNAKDRAHFAQSFEFCSVVASCDTADVLAPNLDNPIERRFGAFLPQHDGNVQRDFNRLVNGFRKGLGMRNAPVMQRSVVAQDYDLFLFVAWSPQSLVELTRIKGWRNRCKVAVAYLFELWSSTLEQNRVYLKLLDQFDHVFLLHSKCLPDLASYTKAPCSALPVGVDCLLATPFPSPPERVVDVYSIGNRSAAVHRALLERGRRGDFFYVYTPLASSNSLVRDWSEHRSLLMGMIKRSRYLLLSIQRALMATSLPRWPANRSCRGACSRAPPGALSSWVRLRAAENFESLAWPDAVIEISPDGSDVISVMDELDGDFDRGRRIRRNNIAGCLLRHDWAYRWEHILGAVGMAPLPQLLARKAKLATAANAVSGLTERDLMVTRLQNQTNPKKQVPYRAH